MNKSRENIKTILTKYTYFIDKLSTKYSYPANIRHLLYIVVPLFILKYGLGEERLILNSFLETEIILLNERDDKTPALFSRILIKENNKYHTDKKIIFQNYESYSFLFTLDALIHEFNHAVNSYKNEIKIENNVISIRTGLCYINYNEENIRDVIGKSEDVILEEIINTKQTESIMNLVFLLGEIETDNEEINNTLYAIKSEIRGKKYISRAYLLHSYIAKELLKNKTFISTMENLRLKGHVGDIEGWFNNITGDNNSYTNLIKLLNKIITSEEKTQKSRWFRKRTYKKIISNSCKVMEIIDKFNDGSIYK